MGKLNMPDAQWIADDRHLVDVCQEWLREPFLAVDTEFMRTTTFYPQAGLIQVASSQGCFLIDPLLIKNWQPLAEVFQHPLVVKVFHACAEDLEVCRRLMGCIPAPLADSQHAAALAGLGSSMGFQRVISAVLDVDVPKEETRSNWLERPLRPEQISYAVADVYYLYKLYPKLVAMLNELGREPWFSEDCARLSAEAEMPEALENNYRKVKLAWKLRPQEQFVLQQLVVWRDQQARLRDVPRNKVVENSVLWNMARFKARNRDQLVKAGVRGSAVREDGKVLLQIISQALAAESNQWPLQLDRPLSPVASQWSKDLKVLIRERAEELDIPAELLVKKKALEHLLRSGYPSGPFALPEVLTGWRKAEIGEHLLDQLTQYAKAG